MLEPLERLKRVATIARQRITGTVALVRDDVTRAFTIHSLGNPDLANTLPYTWKGEAHVRFWGSALRIEVTTPQGSVTDAQTEAVNAAIKRDAKGIREDSLQQIADWFNSTYADEDEYADKEWYNAPLNSHQDVLAKVERPTLVLDLSETSVPGRFELHFPWWTHNFYDFKVSVNLWKVQPQN